MKQTCAYLVVAASLAALLPCGAAASDFVVVVNKESKVTEVTKADLKRLYTGKKTELGGAKAVPVSQALDGELAKVFLADVVGMTPDEYREYWLAEQVKGTGSAPMIQKSNEAVIAVVSQLPGGIGYVHKDKATDAVRIVPVK